MSSLGDFITKMGAGGGFGSSAAPTVPTAPAAPPGPAIPEGHVNAGGVMVPRGAPQPGQLGTPTNPLSAAQVETLVAPNNIQYSGLQPKTGDNDILGMMKFMALHGGFGGDAPKPMSNMDYAQQYGSTTQRAPAAQIGGGSFLEGNNPGDILANVLNRR